MNSLFGTFRTVPIVPQKMLPDDCLVDQEDDEYN